MFNFLSATTPLSSKTFVVITRSCFSIDPDAGTATLAFYACQDIRSLLTIHFGTFQARFISIGPCQQGRGPAAPPHCFEGGRHYIRYYIPLLRSSSSFEHTELLRVLLLFVSLKSHRKLKELERL